MACRWLRAVALERSGDVAGAERGLALLHRAGAESDHPLMDLLQRYRAAPRSDIGRNEPCWCGSGRKYKKCHLRREELPLAERAAWLYAKATQHLLLCARVVPAGDTVQGFGGIEPVAPDERDALIELLDAEPDPVELVGQLSGRFAP